MNMEDLMETEKPDAGSLPKLQDIPATPKLPLAIWRLLGATPETEWPKIRAFLVGSEEELELVDMLPEINRVMNQCPSKLMGRIWKREISIDQPDRAYIQLHDSIHGVRQAAEAVLELAGFRDYRGGDGGPTGSGASGPGTSVRETPVPAGPAAVRETAPRSGPF
ncbi:MAG TPA: hypothetical protein VG457_17470 [Planctomycetota bacterium]|jgi:hypothetical protein|nr:hypothetical protein [Planctomycetota bacterium]